LCTREDEIIAKCSAPVAPPINRVAAAATVVVVIISFKAKISVKKHPS
jgi:hypothetical protein